MATSSKTVEKSAGLLNKSVTFLQGLFTPSNGTETGSSKSNEEIKKMVEKEYYVIDDASKKAKVENIAGVVEGKELHPQTEIVKEFYGRTEKELREEIKLLSKEGENLEKNRTEIVESIREFREDVGQTQIRMELLRASINNARKWIQESNNQNFTIENEEELVEFRNKAARQLVLLTSEEKAIEATIKAVTDAMHKHIVQPKDALQVIRNLTTNVFYIARHKERVEAAAKAIPQ